MKSSVVRVAVNNNFNCTIPEWSQLDFIASQNPKKYFFINCNIRTPRLPTIKDHNYKAVITVNPDIKVKESEVPKLLFNLIKIKDHIAFVRLKYVPDQGSFKILLSILLAMNIPVVITLQRFNSLESITKFSDKKHYAYSCSRFRLTGPALDEITKAVAGLRADGRPVWICDQKGLGCQGCKLCSKLTFDQTGSLKIESLNLSSSGICPYNCPDCYAKTMQNFCKKMGYRPIIFDTIKQNEKQAGRTKHIKEALKNVKRRNYQNSSR